MIFIIINFKNKAKKVNQTANQIVNLNKKV
jgi:hypothetical protein